jgi:hypothetical protein
MARKPNPEQVSLPFDPPSGDEPQQPNEDLARVSTSGSEQPSSRRGRPRKWDSEAERKRAYRQRKAADLAEPDRLRRELRNERRRVATRDRELARLGREVDQAVKKTAAAEHEKVELLAKQMGLERRVEFFQAKLASAENRLDKALEKDSKDPFRSRL